MQLYVQLTQ